SIGYVPAALIMFAGFMKYAQSGITIQVAQTTRLDVSLQVGATSETVTVTAESTLLKTESAEQSYNISTTRINALPLNFSARGPGSFRNPLTFVQLLPGGSITDRNNIRVNGMPNATFAMRLEGQDTTRPLDPLNSDMVAPSVEAVQEISVQTSNFAAEYGQVAGGLFNFTTKSGNNQFHGSLYGYFYNEGLHAGKPFTDDLQGKHLRPKDRRQDSGGSLGGRVYIPGVYDGRNKTFFFFNIEKYVNRGNISGTFTTMPSPEMRGGDFGAILTGRVLATDPAGRNILENTIYDPANTYVQNGARLRDPFVGNQIPASRFDPVTAKINAYLPLPTRSGLVNNFAQAGPTVRKNEITSEKIDHTVSEKLKINFYLHYYRARFGNNGVDGLAPPLTAKRLGGARTPTIRLNADYTLSPTMILHLGAGVVREHVPDHAAPGVQDFDSVAVLGLTGAVSLGFPRITGLSQGSFGGVGIGIGQTNANDYYAVKPTAVSSVTWVRNNHTYKLGGEWKIDAFINRNGFQSYGAYAFSNQQTTLPSTQGQSLGGGIVGHGYASFLLGRPNQGTIANFQDPHYRKSSWGMFLQDTWKLTRKLTLDYGVRWDYQSAIREVWDRTSGFDPSRPNPSAGGRLGASVYEGFGPGRCNCVLAKTYPYAVGPRAGAAYQIDSKTVLRGGVGVSYGQMANFNYMGTTVGTGYNTLNITSTSFGDPAFLMRDGLHYDPALLYAADLNPGIRPTPGQIDSPSGWIDPNGGRPARILQWSFGLQREITRNLVVEANYVGNRGTWFQSNGLIDLNALTPQALGRYGLNIANAADRSLLIARLDSSLAAQRGFNGQVYPGYSTGNTVAQSLRPFPQFGGVGSRFSPLGNTWYDSLQAKATQRFSHGLDFTLSFTWQKELTRGSDDQGGGTATANGVAATNDVFNRVNQKYISPNSQPLVSVLAVNYQTPAVTENKYVRYVTSGWTVSAILRYASGTPLALPGSQNALASLLFRGTRMNRVDGQPLFLKDLNCHCFDPYKDLVLNPAAWKDAAPGEWGVSAAYYNDYRAQRRPDEQLSLGRSFRIREGMNLQFRGEFFNAFNRTVFAAPSNGNPTATVTNTPGLGLSGGFGFINGLNSGTPRNGQVVIRLGF
ncbi:MAG: TonB-dependent receptor, partial [Acidobacteriota bacterium]